MKRVAIIGAGVSGLSRAQQLKNAFKVTVFEKESRPGGLIRCERINGSLFHICGGHVFNTKNPKVDSWFCSRFDRDVDFIKADRVSSVCLDNGQFIDYPIENHVYQLDESTQKNFINDMLKAGNASDDVSRMGNFGSFLRNRFGDTLYKLYFEPYNEKVWRCNLKDVPMDWLAGKLPMPTAEEMLFANMNHVEEKDFVHASFWYPRFGGSQFIADTLAKDIDIEYGMTVSEISRDLDGKIKINGRVFDIAVFCGNVKDLPRLVGRLLPDIFDLQIKQLNWHGTTSVFCEFDNNPYTWIYLPSKEYGCHRIICTGSFSGSNNAHSRCTGTVEFTGEIDKTDILSQLQILPLNPVYITYKYNKYSYPIQYANTRTVISNLRDALALSNVFLCGRFAEWEYYNMDAAMASAIELCDFLKEEKA